MDMQLLCIVAMEVWFVCWYWLGKTIPRYLRHGQAPIDGLMDSWVSSPLRICPFPTREAHRNVKARAMEAVIDSFSMILHWQVDSWLL